MAFTCYSNFISNCYKTLLERKKLIMSNPFFSIDHNKDNEEDKNMSSSFKSKYLCQHFQKIENLEKDLNRLPEKDEFFFLQTQNAFNAFTFIPKIIQSHSISHLYASTYSLSRRVVNALIELHDQGYIDQITLLVSDSMIKRNPTTIDLLCGLVTSYPNIKVYFGWNHSKVALAKTKEAHYVIEGSGNWSENAHIEQYIFSNSKNHYEFRKQIFTESEIRYTADSRGLRKH